MKPQQDSRQGGVLRRPLPAAAVILFSVLAVVPGASAETAAPGDPAQAATLVGSGSSVSPRPPADSAAPSATGTFSISGSVSGLYPGAALPLVLTVNNPQTFRIIVTSLTTSVGRPSGTCTASYLTVAGFSGRLAVPARGQNHTTVQATLLKAAPNACQGATFPLTFAGKAIRG